MAHTIGALKRARQSGKRGMRNGARRSAARTYMKKVREAVTKKDAKAAEALLPLAIQALDKASRLRALHPNYAARHKSRLVKLVGTLAT